MAQEVRNLATRSAEASKDTSALIANSLNTVKIGTDIADETANSLETVLESVKHLTEIVGQITAASRYQSDSIHQIEQGIDQISDVVQMNSATAEESAAASEELLAQARVLEKLVEQFHLTTIETEDR